MSTTTTGKRPGLTVSRMSLTSRLAGPIIIGAVLTMLIVPLTPFAISMLFALNISAGLVILASSIYVSEASELLSFPSILLATTLMRLALNVATARAILLNGYTGSDAAGAVIQSFGRFVVGGNYVVGFIIFGILITINFVVVTKGSSRVAEVSARFTLDSLPGRQMAIDADVNAGALTPKEAEKRREALRNEADFFGAMDGASKFVRGDVVAAMIILVVNLVGGLLVGTLQHGLPLDVAARNYTLLTVGDGVAAQIPSLTISIAAGLIVTRVSTGEDISAQIVSQIGQYPQSMLVAAGLLAALGIVPGMAHVPFLLFAAFLAFVGFRGLQHKRRTAEALAADKTSKPETTPDPAQSMTIDKVQKVDPFGLEIGFALVPLLGQQQDGKPSLESRLTAVRSRYSTRMGFLLPNIHIRDSEQVRPQGYQFTIRGGVIGAGDVIPDLMLAIENEDVLDRITTGRQVKEPVFGNPAIWISPDQVADAEIRGYTVVDPAGVIATHLESALRRHGSEMLGRREAEDIVGLHAKSHPKLIEDLRNRYQMGTVRQVLASLVAEDVPVRDFERIAEAMTDVPEPVSREPERLLAAVRVRLSRQIIAPFLDPARVLRVLALDPDLEAVVTKAIDTARSQGLDGIAEPRVMKLLRQAALGGRQIAETHRVKPVLTVSGLYRYPVARALHEIMPVIALEEIPDTQATSVIAAIKPSPENET